jgi:hypothetical protein
MIAMNMKQIAAGLGLSMAALTVHGDGADLRNMVEVFRSDMSAEKKATIVAAMKLNEYEAKVFWPIYREYEIELAKLGDQRLALIEQFFKAHIAGSLNDSQAQDISDKWFALMQQRLDLWKVYHGKVAKALSPMRAAQFVQVEHQVSLLLDIGIASEMPVIGAKGQ